MTRWGLGVDLGTSFSAAAIAQEGRAEALDVGGDRRVPSTVLLTEDGRLLAGSHAQRTVGRLPDRAERNPKRYVGRAPMLLGGRPVTAVDALAALLGLFVQEARRRHDDTDPDGLVLTHPVSWTEAQRAELREVAARVLPGVTATLLDEPTAAALHLLHEEAVTGPVAVYDLGGGTFDTAVVTADGDGLRVLGRPGGDPELGGEVFDQLVYRSLGEQLAHTAPEWWEQVAANPDRPWLAAAADLLAEARQAKESLSDYESASQYVPGADADVHLSRAELEDLIGDDVRRSVRLFADTVGSTPVRAVLLTGGAARTPLVGRLLRETYGDLVRTLPDPKSAVALGAARWALRNAGGPASGSGSGDDRTTARVADAGRAPSPARGAGPDRIRADRAGADRAGRVDRPAVGVRAAGGRGAIAQEGPADRTTLGRSKDARAVGGVGGGAGAGRPGAEAGGRAAVRAPARAGGLVTVTESVLDARVAAGALYTWSTPDGAAGAHRITRLDPRSGRVLREVVLGRLVGWAVSGSGLLVTERRDGELHCHLLGRDLSIGPSSPLPTPYRPFLLADGPVAWAVLRSPDTHLTEDGRGEVGSLAVRVFRLGAGQGTVPGPVLPLGPATFRYADPERRILHSGVATSTMPTLFGDGRSCVVVLGRPLAPRGVGGGEPARQALRLVGPTGDVLPVADQHVTAGETPWVQQVVGAAGRWLLATTVGLESYADLRHAVDRRLFLPRPAAGATAWAVAGRQAYGLAVERAVPGRGLSLHALVDGQRRDLGRWPLLLGTPAAARPDEAARVRADGDHLLVGIGDGAESHLVRADPAAARVVASAPGWLEPVGRADGVLLARHVPGAAPGDGCSEPGRLVRLPG